MKYMQLLALLKLFKSSKRSEKLAMTQNERKLEYE